MATSAQGLPPSETVYWHFARWVADGSVQRAHDALRDEVRDRTGRDPMVSAGVIDAQSVPAADKVASDNRGYDAGKKVNGASGTSSWTLSGCCSWSS